MLEFIRRHANSVLVKAFLGVLAITFVFCFGISDIIRRVTGRNYIVKVGNIEITPEAFRLEKARVLSMMRGRVKNVDEKTEGSKILYQMIWENIVDLAAADFGFVVSDSTIKQYIGSAWKFRDDKGRFSASLLRGFLKKIQIPEQMFIEFSRKDIKKALINAPFKYVSTDYDLDDYIKASKEKRILTILELNPVSFDVPRNPTQEDLDAFRDDHPDLFTVDEKRSFRILEMHESDIAKNIEILPQEVREAYDFSPEKEDKTFDQMKSELESSLRNEKLESEINGITRQIEDALMGGEKVEAVVKKFKLKTTVVSNVDSNNKNEKSKDVLKHPYKNDILTVAFSIDENTDSSFSEALDEKGNRVLWLVHIDRVDPKHVPEISKISDKVRQEWIRSRQEEKALELAKEFIKKAKLGENLERFASKNGRTSRVSKAFDRNGLLDGKKSAAISDDVIGKIYKTAFSLEKTGASFERHNGKVVVYQVKDIVPNLDVDTDREKFRDELRNQRTDDLYQQMINHLSKRYKMKINYEMLKEINEGAPAGTINFDEMF